MEQIKGEPPKYQSSNFTYKRRSPESTVLYKVIQENWKSFLAAIEGNGDSILPSYVKKEFTKFLTCGVLANGFLRLKCEDCKHEKLLAFSCKQRGFCSSCCARRMSESAAFWTENIFPQQAVRQWVLSVPIPLRYWMARNPELLNRVLTIVIRAIQRAYVNNAKRRGLNVDLIRTGSVVYVQRSGGSVNVNPHFHILFVDGVFFEENGIGFQEAEISHAEVEATIARIQRRIVRLLEKLGLKMDYVDSHNDEQQGRFDIMDLCQTASVQNLVALGQRAGQRVRKIGSFGRPDEQVWSDGVNCVSIGGFSLHANVFIKKHNRGELEKLCRYLARPPVAETRLARRENGDIIYHLKKGFCRKLFWKKHWPDNSQRPKLVNEPVDRRPRLKSRRKVAGIHFGLFGAHGSSQVQKS